MTEINRKAGVIWNGDSRSGKGFISTESRVLFEQPFNYAARFGEEAGTNPEELIAAAHAACYSMALASTLKKNGFMPKQIATNVTCSVVSQDGGHEITSMHLYVHAEVPEIDEPTFRRLAMEADQRCPVSKILRQGLNIQIEADLDPVKTQ